MVLYTNFLWHETNEPQQMLVEDDKVVARQAQIDASKAEVVDLKGQTLLPSFIDAHCHILPTGLDLQRLQLGACYTEEEVLQAVRDRLPEIEEGKWLHAVHYEQTRFKTAEHLTRHDLDKISTTTPIVLRHVNGHASVVNTAALQAAGIAEDVQDPEGGAFRRDARGQLDGVLLEQAHEKVTFAAPRPTLEEMIDAILRAGESMAGYNIACASDMMTGRFNLERELEAYKLAAERGCKIRTRLYVQWSTVFGPRGVTADGLRQLTTGWDEDRVKVAGIKIFADGAIGSATAAIYGQYSGEEANGPVINRHAQNTKQEGTSGQLMYPPDRLKQMVKTAHDAGYQLAIHTIGDYSTDLVMEAYEALDNPAKHRIEHAMLLSDAQIERMAKLGSFLTFQPEFLVRFGNAYLKQLGPERTAKLERARSVVDAGIPLSLSSDRPIVSGDPRLAIETITNRPETFDPAENLTQAEAFKAYTEEAAKANGDSNMGALLPGQLADFQLAPSGLTPNA